MIVATLELASSPSLAALDHVAAVTARVFLGRSAAVLDGTSRSSIVERRRGLDGSHHVAINRPSSSPRSGSYIPSRPQQDPDKSTSRCALIRSFQSASIPLRFLRRPPRGPCSTCNNPGSKNRAIAFEEVHFTSGTSRKNPRETDFEDEMRTVHLI